MDDDQFQRALEEGGLSTYQAEAYVVLLNKGMASAMEVANECTVPSSQVYEVLRSLEKKGYVETFEQDTLQARPTNPEDVLETLRNKGSLLVDGADEVEERWQQPAMSEHHMTVFKRSDTVIAQARKQIKEAEIAIELACRLDQFAELMDELKVSRERGVTIKLSLYTDRDPKNELDIDLLDYASEVRACYIPGPFLCIIDRSRTCYAPNSKASEQFGLVFNDHLLSFIFHWFFQSCHWNTWDTTAGPTQTPTAYVNIQEFIHELAPLFFEGATIDVTIRGRTIETGDTVWKKGTVVDIIYRDRYLNQEPKYEDLAGFAALVIESNGDLLTVGGWGAVYEDIEGQLVYITDIDFPFKKP